MRGSRTIPGAGAPCARWSVSARACWPVRSPISNPVVALLGIALVAMLGLAWYLGARLLRSERDRRRATDELNRRLSELFSLQELSYVLSDSLERSEEHTSELQSPDHLVCRLLLEKKKKQITRKTHK